MSESLSEPIHPLFLEAETLADANGRFRQSLEESQHLFEEVEVDEPEKQDPSEDQNVVQTRLERIKWYLARDLYACRDLLWNVLQPQAGNNTSPLLKIIAKRGMPQDVERFIQLHERMEDLRNQTPGAIGRKMQEIGRAILEFLGEDTDDDREFHKELKDIINELESLLSTVLARQSPEEIAGDMADMHEAILVERTQKNGTAHRNGTHIDLPTGQDVYDSLVNHFDDLYTEAIKASERNAAQAIVRSLRTSGRKLLELLSPTMDDGHDPPSQWEMITRKAFAIALAKPDALAIVRYLRQFKGAQRPRILLQIRQGIDASQSSETSAIMMNIMDNVARRLGYGDFEQSTQPTVKSQETAR